MNKRRNGKVARLPKAMREIVNQMLDDGETYNTIVQKLEELGYPNFNDMNIHTWEKGGYRDWHVEQERLSYIREANLSLLDPQARCSAAGLASMNLAAQQLYGVLTDFDPDLLRQRLAQHPQHYFHLILAFSRLLKNRVAFENLLRDEADQKLLLERYASPEQEKKEKPDTA